MPVAVWLARGLVSLVRFCGHFVGSAGILFISGALAGLLLGGLEWLGVTNRGLLALLGWTALDLSGQYWFLRLGPGWSKPIAVVLAHSCVFAAAVLLVGDSRAARERDIPTSAPPDLRRHDEPKNQGSA